MNDVFNNVMTFINKNTYLLIGICVFLILVLIPFLSETLFIDSIAKSVRSSYFDKSTSLFTIITIFIINKSLNIMII